MAKESPNRTASLESNCPYLSKRTEGCGSNGLFDVFEFETVIAGHSSDLLIH